MYKRTVAILATNPAFSSIYGRFLTESCGYKVPCFEHGAALQTFLQIAPVQVIVVDDEARSGGIETMRAVRTHPKLAYPDPGIMVITRARPAVQHYFRAAGADIVLEKPVRHGRLADEVHRLFALAGQRRLPLALGETHGYQFASHASADRDSRSEAKVISLDAWKRANRQAISPLS
ncbi:response regulator [Devosia ginsengisoli]|uniref:Response regulator n=1 Tax=Devosia ginsengisoli TaxID=400770 RepID=A0A5B8LNX6_9HYPH|nr:response regulator [Devosia ginsengisoli]QDZ09796.1 response regulator [Devosia ginsengisoli]